MKTAILDNAKRSNRLEVAMLALREEYGDDPSTILIDLLADAMHWCRRNGQDFDHALGIAANHFQTEIIEETGVFP